MRNGLSACETLTVSEGPGRYPRLEWQPPRLNAKFRDAGHDLPGPVAGRYLIGRNLIRGYFAAGGSSFWSIRDCSPLRNESSVSIVLENPARRSLIVLTKARGPAGAP